MKAREPEGRPESALIQTFLRARGLDASAVPVLPADEAKRAVTAASVSAPMRLAEVEARAHGVHAIHSEQ